MKIKKKQKGIGVVAILLIITIVLSIGGIGYYVYNSKSDTTKPDIKIRDEDDGFGGAQPEKPVIYLYPEEETEVKVELEYNGRFISTYPEYDYSIKGWQVVAKPDGTLINKSDNKEYSYLFWDGVDNTEYDLSTGFVVKGEDTKVFLQNTLKRIGLTPKEYNEMIVYWLPKMEYNKYNLIHFAGDKYTDTAKLTVTPKPDSMLRVFMVYKPLVKYKEIEPQQITSFKRNGFSVIEWGGSEVR